MTEEVNYSALEGDGEEPQCYLFFVTGSKKVDFINFLKNYHLEKDFRVQKGDGRMFCFHLDIRDRADYPELEALLNKQQIAYLR